MLAFVYGRRSILFNIKADDSRNIRGYFNGLSSLSYAQNHCLHILAYIEFRRGIQDFLRFHKKQVNLLQRKRFQNLVNHVRVKMTCAACIYLYNRDSETADPFSVSCACNVTFYNSGFIFPFSSFMVFSSRDVLPAPGALIRLMT